jgi:exopolysaccharide biosynthesis polyprenyl glycosylphosphotransferase
MKTRNPVAYVLALRVSDLLASVVSLTLAGWLRQTLPYGRSFDAGSGGTSLSVYLLIIVIWTVVFQLVSAYDANWILRFVHEMQAVWTGIFLSILLLAGVLYLSYLDLSRLLFLYFALMEVIFTTTFRIVVRQMFKRLRLSRVGLQRVLLVGAGDVGQKMGAILENRRWMGLEAVGFVDDDPAKLGKLVADLPVLGPLSESLALVQEHHIHEVIITLPLYAHKELAGLISMLNQTPVSVAVVPDVFPLAFLRPSIGMLGEMPLIALKEPILHGNTRLAKRMLDLVVATSAVALLWPLMLLLAACIRLDSPGPALFKQTRIGWNGKAFVMYKFRTMVQGADRQIDIILERDGNGKHYMRKDKPDPRVTRLGRFLRRWSLDELPQLFNVLRGEMSIVGPRPELPSFVQGYEARQRKRLAVPPGMTGWWQVTERADSPMALSSEADLYYVGNYSLTLDLKILFRTLGAVVRGKGAY